MEEIDDEYLLQKYPDSPSCIVSVKELDELTIIVQENVDNGWPKEHYVSNFQVRTSIFFVI